MFKLQRFISVSQRLFPFPPLTYSKCSLIFNRIAYNSGCLIAGCCFSKKSEEEELVSGSTSKNKHIFSKNIGRRNAEPISKFENCASSSNNMKRNFDSINNSPSQNAVSEQAVQESDSKKKRIDSNDKLAQIQQPVNELATEDSITEPPCAIGEARFKTKEENQKKLRPNYFVAIKISDDQIHHELKELQTHILQKDERLKNSLNELKTLHITLFVMHIGDPETHARAVETLENIHREYNEEMSNNPMLLKFQGLSHFQNRVLFAKVIEDDAYERLQKLVKSVKRHYESASIFSTDSRPDFTPHLTVAKIDFRKRQNRFIKKINPSYYKDFDNQYFGAQKVESIQLLSMLNPKTETGYYSGTEIYFSAFEPSLRRKALIKQLEIEEKKINIKEIINAAMKEKLK